MSKLTPKKLGQLFLKYYPVDENGYSEKAYMSDLVKISPDFKTTNGCQWARSGDGSWLGKQFEIERLREGGRSITSVQLIGFRKRVDNHTIPSKVKELKYENCAILDIGTNIEIDHKNGRYNQEIYDTFDFQPLCKTANDAKRQHCKECLMNKRRYDATRLGYKVPFIKGDFNSDYCEGCYWYDPVTFNKVISENYNV